MTFGIPVIFVLLVLLVLLPLIVGIANTDEDIASAMVSISAIAILLLLPTGLLFLARYVGYKSSEFAVTNQRLMIKVGWIRRNTLELLLNKIESVSVDQSIIGRIFDFGSITVTGTGGAKSPFQKIAKPMDFRNQVHRLLAEKEE